MRLTALVSAGALGGLPIARGLSGQTTTTWDCCKPSCSWSQNARLGGADNPVKVCGRDNSVLSNGPSASNGCQGGVGYSCHDFQPRIINETFSYGFAGNWQNSNCCKCFFTWTSGNGRGKSMIVQVVNAGGVGTGDFDIYTPGGGVGDFNACTNQYGAPGAGWGRQYGGVQSDRACDGLPAALQEGCHWRWQWAGGDVNTWKTDYREVSCPSALTDISGCAAGGGSGNGGYNWYA